MKKFSLILLFTLATAYFTQAQDIFTLPGDEPHVPPPDWIGAWPPMPSPDYSSGYSHVPPPSPYSWPPLTAPPEWGNPDQQGMDLISAGINPTPEPTATALFAIGGIAAFFWRRRA